MKGIYLGFIEENKLWSNNTEYQYDLIQREYEIKYLSFPTSIIYRWWLLS